MKWFFTLVLTMLLPVFGWAADVQFPADAGFVNVKEFGAKGDGITDDTAAINAALAASGEDTGTLFWQDKIVYFPRGTYLVSAPIEKRYADGRYGSGMNLMGESRTQTIIKLKNDEAGYGDKGKPKAVIFTSAKLLDGTATSGGKDYVGKGEGNDAYANFIENLTVDVGANSGAIGIDYLANNLGAIRHVTVKGNGETGISMIRKWPGPALLTDIVVDGFDVGIDVAERQYGVTLEHVTLKNQNFIGLQNKHNVIAAHDLKIENTPSPIANHYDDGLVVNTGGKFSGIYLGDKRINGNWTLPVKDAPVPYAEPTNKWVSVAAFGAKPDATFDSTQAIQKAFNSGAATVYFPHGTYEISDRIIVPHTVRRIVGMMSAIHGYKIRSPNFQREQGMFRVKNNHYPLTIEHLAFDHSNLGIQVAVEALGQEPLVLRDVEGAGVMTLRRPATGGEVFVENTCCGTMDIKGKAGVWARQLDTEGEGVRIANDGAPLWILGIKTELNCTVIENRNGANTELLGGLIYQVRPAENPLPAFINTDSRMALSYAEEAFNPDALYTMHLVNTQKGKRHITKSEALQKRNLARVAPLLVGE